MFSIDIIADIGKNNVINEPFMTALGKLLDFEQLITKTLPKRKCLFLS